MLRRRHPGDRAMRFMIETRILLGAAIAAAHLLTGCKDDAGAPPVPTPAPTLSAVKATRATVAALAAAATSAPSGAAPPAPSGSAAAKSFDCGAKGQQPCPMQGWMKRVMAPASSSADGEKLAKALLYVADHAPPGYKGWAVMAKAGAERAKAGDIEGAKVSCQLCHDAYKESYQATMRDQPF
jgi:outer membrane murein-binding lipoprotein Lpp